MVVLQRLVGDGEQFLADVRADLQFAGGRVHQIDDRPGRGVAAAGVPQRGDEELAALDLVARPRERPAKKSSFLFNSRFVA